jgi:peroxiredoxin family protein
MSVVTEAPMIKPFFDEDVETDRTLAIICSKGSLDMAYPGLILGNAALGEGVDVHLFFTFWGFDMITKGRMEHLTFSPVGNPATHIPAALAPMPGMAKMATHMMNKSLEELEIPPVPEFLDLLKASGAKLWACRLSADMNHLTEADLYEGVDGIINASDFIELTDGAQLLFI